MVKPAIADKDTTQQRFAVNVASNIGLVLLNIVVGIWFTPYLIEKLGVAIYAIVTLANTLTVYVMMFFNSAINQSIGRFLTLYLRQGQLERANRTFNTMFWTTMVLGFVLLPISWFVVSSAPLLFDIPNGYERDAQLLFSVTLMSAILVLVRGVFAASSFARNRLDLDNFVMATNTIVRVFVVVILFTVTIPTLWHVGAGIFAGSVLSFMIAVFVWRFLTPELFVSIRLFDRTQLSELSQMSGWVFVNQVGSLLFLNIDLIVLNTVVNATVQGLYASVLQWSILLRTLAQTVARALTPMILAQFARQDWSAMALLSKRSVKMLGLVMALPVGAIVGFSDPLLYVWLGAEFVDMAPVLRALVLPLAINLAVVPLFSLQVALNKLKVPGLITLLSGVGNLVLAIYFAEFGVNGFGVALAGGIMLTLKNTLFIPIYGASIQHLKWNTFLLMMVPSLIGAILTAVTTYFLASIFFLQSWLMLSTAGIFVAIGYGIGIYLFALSKHEKQWLLAIIRDRKV